jgi:putative heme transporter
VRGLRIDISPRTMGLVLLVVFGVWLAFKLTSVLVVIVVALVLAGTLNPLVQWLEDRGLRRGQALVLLFIALSMALGAVILLTFPPLISQLLHLIEEAPRTRDQLVVTMQAHGWSKSFIASAKALPLHDLAANLGGRLINYSSQVLTVLGFAVSTLFLAIYLLSDPLRAKGLLYAVVPRSHHVKLARILIELQTIVGGYMRGQVITSVSIGAFVFVLLTAFGVEDALALALFAALTDVIPFIGGYIASLPVIAAVAASGAGMAATIGVTVVMVLYQEFESRLLVPSVYGRVLRLPPAIVIVALLVGGTLMGVFGALLALPIAAGLQMLLRELRVALPGEAPASAATRASDDQLEHEYEQRAEGSTAANAGAIADELALEGKVADLATAKADAAQAVLLAAEVAAAVAVEVATDVATNIAAAVAAEVAAGGVAAPATPLPRLPSNH